MVFSMTSRLEHIVGWLTRLDQTNFTSSEVYVRHLKLDPSVLDFSYLPKNSTKFWEDYQIWEELPDLGDRLTRPDQTNFTRSEVYVRHLKLDPSVLDGVARQNKLERFVYYESIKLMDLRVSHTVVWGTGTPEDRDEVDRWEVCECDGWVCDLESIGVPSILSVIHNTTSLVRMLSTFDLICEENSTRW